MDHEDTQRHIIKPLKARPSFSTVSKDYNRIVKDMKFTDPPKTNFGFCLRLIAPNYASNPPLVLIKINDPRTQDICTELQRVELDHYDLLAHCCNDLILLIPRGNKNYEVASTMDLTSRIQIPKPPSELEYKYLAFPRQGSSFKILCFSFDFDVASPEISSLLFTSEDWTWRKKLGAIVNPDLLTSEDFDISDFHNRPPVYHNGTFYIICSNCLLIFDEKGESYRLYPLPLDSLLGRLCLLSNGKLKYTAWGDTNPEDKLRIWDFNGEPNDPTAYGDGLWTQEDSIHMNTFSHSIGFCYELQLLFVNSMGQILAYSFEQKRFLFVWKLERFVLEKALPCTFNNVDVNRFKPPDSKIVAAQEAQKREEFRRAVSKTLERHFFYGPSFKNYGGIPGFYDYGPPGCTIKHNVIAFWRKHFVIEENMLEVDCPCITPEAVLKASGHVDKFSYNMVKDENTGVCYRADHLLKDFCNEKLERDPNLAEKATEYKHVLAVLDDLPPEELGAKIMDYGITAPDTFNPLSAPYPFNLMFQTSIGPSGLIPGYLRPEISQGIFVNFKDLYNYNRSTLPFAAAQIGQAFRNEISPRQGLVSVREFTLAEFEHFVDPENTSHPKFSDVSKLEFLMFPREDQSFKRSARRIPLGEAVGQGIINNQTLGYFIGRAYLFLTELGIDRDRVRFRQYLQNEMAHYAADCWDAEIECSYGWIGCVGISDRSQNDLRALSEKIGVPLIAHEKLPQPREVEKVVILPVKKELELALRGDQRMVVEALEAMGETEAFELKATLESQGEANFQVCTLGKAVTIKNNMVSISKEKVKEHHRAFTPSVIESSFGIGRIIYCIYEHCFYTRSRDGNDQPSVFRFTPLVAPIKCTVFPLVETVEYKEVARQIEKELTVAGLSYKSDTTGTSTAKRYARTDELGVPFVITVDSKSSVTVRERDRKEQVHVPVDEVVLVIKKLIEGQSTWADVMRRFGSVGH